MHYNLAWFATIMEDSARWAPRLTTPPVQVGFQHCHRDGVDWVFVTHPSYVRPGEHEAPVTPGAAGSLPGCLRHALYQHTLIAGIALAQLSTCETHRL